MKVTSPSHASLQSLNRSRSRSHDNESSSSPAQQQPPSFASSLLQHKKNCLDFTISRQPHLALKGLKEMGMSLSNFSVTTWLRIEKFASPKFDETNVILAQSPLAEKPGDNNNFVIAVRQQKLWFSFGSDELVCESPLLEKSQWYHVAFVYDLPARTMTIYINGERKAVGTNKNPSAAPNKLFIGSYEDARCKLRGALSEFHIYLHALSRDDVRRLCKYDQCGYTQFTPFWTKSYNHADARLPRRKDVTDSDILSSHLSSETACIQANAMDVYLVSPPAGAAEDLSNLRSTFLRAGDKTVVPCRNPKCQQPMNLLAREATLRINIDSFPQYKFNVAFACFRVSLNYTGPVLRLRRGNEFVEKDFFADAQGTLHTQDGQTLNSWSLGSDAFVSVWYTQTGDARFNAIQPEPSLQPRYLPGKKTIHFGENQFLRMNPATLAAGNASYSFIIKHGRVEEMQGGFFGIGRAEANQGVSLQRQKVNNGYRCYWIDSDHQFGGYSRGNTVFEVYDADAGMRTAGVNGKVANELRRVSPKKLSNKNPDNSDAQAFLGRGLDYFSAKTPSLCGEIEYFFCTDAAMTLSDIQRLYRPGMRLYDYCVACFNCDQLVTVEQLRDVAQVCVRCNDHPRGVDRGVEEVHFCYTHGVAQSHFLERVADAKTHTFRLNRKIDERIARIDFQQREDLGLLNLRFVTNTARTSPVLGAPWREDAYLTYSYTAPSASGGIAGLLFTTTEVDSSPSTTPHARARRLSRVESISMSQKNSKKEKGDSEKSSDSHSNKSSGSAKAKMKIINGILLHNGKIFKVEPNAPRPAPSFFDSLLCCLAPSSIAESVSLSTDAFSPSLSLSGRYTIGVPNEPLTLRALSKKQSFLQLPAGQRATQSRASHEREKEVKVKAEGFARKSSFADAKSIARKASLKGFNNNGIGSAFTKKLSFADATPSVSETDTNTTTTAEEGDGDDDESLSRRAKKSRHGQGTGPASHSLALLRDPYRAGNDNDEEDGYGIAVEKKKVRSYSPPCLAPDRSDSPSLVFAHQLVNDDNDDDGENESDFEDDEEDFTKGYDALLAGSGDISDLYLIGGVSSSLSAATPPSYASFSHNARGGRLAIAEEFLWEDDDEEDEEGESKSERQARFLSHEDENNDDAFLDYLDLYEITKEISRENQPSCFDFGFDRHALRDKFLLPSSPSSPLVASSKSMSCSISRSESEADSLEERSRFGMQFRELSLRDSALLSGSISRCESTDSEF